MTAVVSGAAVPIMGVVIFLSIGGTFPLYSHSLSTLYRL